jgi:hypothetical protein
MTKFVHKPIPLSYELDAKLTEAGRLYQTPSGKWYPSVTTFLGHFGKEGIEGWKKAVGEKEAKRVGHHAVTRGNAVHNTAERYLNNEENYLVECVMPHVRQMWRSLKNVLDRKVNNIVMQECPLYSDELMLAGRVDLISEYNGVLSVIDFKTSSRVKKAEEIPNYFLQACAYSIMYEEQTGIHIDQLVIIMVVEGTDKSLAFVQKRSDWEAELRSKRDEYFQFLRENVPSR